MKINILLSRDTIKTRLKELAKQISQDYRSKDLLLLGILKGSFIFLADLMRDLEIPAECDFLKAKSYVEEKSSGKVEIDFLPAVKKRDILLVEDIIDTGLTINLIKKEIEAQNPKSIKLCTLLNKPTRRQEKAKIDYLGFNIPDKFVVGYGLDYEEKFRNLSYIGVIEKIEC